VSPVRPLGEPEPRRPLAPACETPCSSCPWRTENQGKPHPDGWFTTKNRERLWAKMRRGESMSCHPTDPANPLPPGAPAVTAPVTVECAGSLILVQREAVKLQAFPGPYAFRLYRKAHPKGLTKDGVANLISRTTLAGVPLVGAPRMPLLDLMAPVSHEPVGDWLAWLEAHPETREQRPRGEPAKGWKR
jgi:hypothetical protein